MMESSLDCGVCFYDYNRNENKPKSLPCGHSICATCVKDNLRGKEGKISCPFCRTPCGTGVKTIDDFPTTFALLSLLGSTELKSPPKMPSQREKDKNTLKQKKQAEYDHTGAQLVNCNEYLQKLFHAKEKQESSIRSITLAEKKLLEDYQREQKKLKISKEKVTSINDQLDDVVAEGNDIVKGLEALQDRVQSACSLPGLKMACQDVQKYTSASHEWISSRVKTILKDDIHLIPEEDAEAAGVRMERLKAYAAKKAAKPGPIARSQILLDVKPWDDETDMKALENAVRTIEMDGLVWGASKLNPVHFGINKLSILCRVVDDKVPLDDLSEKIEEFEDFVQSVDIAAWNRV